MEKYLSREFNIGRDRRSSLYNIKIGDFNIFNIERRAQMNPIRVLLYRTNNPAIFDLVNILCDMSKDCFAICSCPSQVMLM